MVTTMVITILIYTLGISSISGLIIVGYLSLRAFSFIGGKCVVSVPINDLLCKQTDNVALEEYFAVV